MPAGKRRQSNAMLYTLITFVALFVVATTAAVIYYVKAEDLRTQAAERQDELNKFASQDEIRNAGTIVGNRLPGQTNLGTVVQHLDQMVKLVKGLPVRTTSAEVKVAEARQAIQPLIAEAVARKYVTLPAPAPVDPNAPQQAGAGQPGDPNAAAVPEVALAKFIGDLLAQLDKLTQEKNATEQQLTKVKTDFDDAIASIEQAKKNLNDKVSAYEQQVVQIQGNYDKLSALADEKTKEQLGTIQGDLEKTRVAAKQLNDKLLRTTAELNVATGRLDRALNQVYEIKPAPDKEAPAFQPDGHVFLVDQSAGIIQIDLGSDDHVYQGLTFSVYDRSAGIPRDGKPKAQVEIFSIDPRVSAARVLSSDPRNPIATGDLIANLIWDPAKQNRFVVTGDFDTNGDGKPDYDGVTRIEALIQKWGGVTSQTVTSLTDYVILGTEPTVPSEPTPQVLTADPTAQNRYDAARQRNEQFNQIRGQAEALCVPIFNYNRFLYFTGYANQIGKPGAL
jgi:hypothetical protein